ncbi:hypothetical protein [Priestia aryabhattai]|uniref:hypothetical protein n=1 Tax=Priestia aryabhattai TaxID=412384 RepID=UPI002452D6FC|nr:hypothetical protein [Priestia aryabhattai]MDH3111338.1 hypothetical protein [Priestia aryabhattai]MDH3129888.1 hypothetical protein [Priestia aryabhattai]
MISKVFERNREELLSLVYEMDKFTEEEITEKFLQDKNGVVFIGDMQTVSEYLLSLCRLGILSYDGFTFKVIPEEKQINHQLFVVSTLA